MTDSKAFGKTLKDIISSKGITEEDLAKEIKTSKFKIEEWETGAKTPNRDFALRIVDALQLNSHQASELLNLAGHLTGGIYFGNVYRPTGIVIDDSVSDESMKLRKQEFQKLEEKLQQTQQAVDDISSKLTTVASGQTVQQSGVLAEVQKLQEILTDIQVPNQSITAPVILPPPEDMEVRLISSTSLQRLEEYRFEENKWYAIAGIFLGAILGLFINLVTGSPITTDAIILVIILFGFTLFTGWTARTYQSRANSIKLQIFREPASKPSKSNH